MSDFVVQQWDLEVAKCCKMRCDGLLHFHIALQLHLISNTARVLEQQRRYRRTGLGSAWLLVELCGEAGV